MSALYYTQYLGAKIQKCIRHFDGLSLCQFLAIHALGESEEKDFWVVSFASLASSIGYWPKYGGLGVTHRTSSSSEMHQSWCVCCVGIILCLDFFKLHWLFELWDSHFSFLTDQRDSVFFYVKNFVFTILCLLHKRSTEPCASSFMY